MINFYFEQLVWRSSSNWRSGALKFCMLELTQIWYLIGFREGIGLEAGLAHPSWQNSNMTNPVAHFSFIKITVTTLSVALIEIVHSISKGWIFILCKILDSQSFLSQFFVRMGWHYYFGWRSGLNNRHWSYTVLVLYVHFAYFVCVDSLRGLTQIYCPRQETS